MKVFVYKIVKCKVNNVEFLSRDHLLNNSAIVLNWKDLKFYIHQKECVGLTFSLKCDTFKTSNS